ncbi:MAG: hypothetical protein HRT36_04670 [Alphaproteobacteria bacterium]|nr:hypothetical protein [Alphaproteobacteria bacterium]
MIKLLSLLFLGCVWTAHVAFSKLIGAESFSAILAVLVLYLCGTTVALLATLLIYHRTLPSFRGTGMFFVVTSSAGYLLPVVVELGVMPHIPVAVFLFVGTLVPVVTLLLAWLLRLEPVRFGHLIGVVLGLAALLLLLGNPFAAGQGWSIWYLIALLMPLSYGAVDCYIEYCWPKNLGLLQVAAGNSMLALGYVLVCAVLFGVTPEQVTTVAITMPLHVLSLTALALLSSIMFFYVVKRAGAVYVSFGAFVALLMGIAAGVVFFAEALPENFGFAFILLLASLLFLHWSSSPCQSQT